MKRSLGILKNAFLLSALMVLALSSSCAKKATEGPQSKSVSLKTTALFPEQENATAAALIQQWCEDTKKSISGLKWKGLEPCEKIDWKSGGLSVKGRPLVYAEFGDPQSPNTTLILSGVHGDEITPHYLALKLARWLEENRESLSKVRVVVAPMVNPDAFFSRPKTRVNARGVDVNRNFATRDWQAKALPAWKSRFKSDPRRFPGSVPGSEPETIFQEQLIQRVKPQKILSVHAPLNFMDYDGPTALSLERFPKEYVNECLKLRQRLKAISGGFFPGSLGNFAGRELGIPTLTLELPSADPAKAERYWKSFSTGIRTMIEFVVPSFSSLKGTTTAQWNG